MNNKITFGIITFAIVTLVSGMTTIGTVQPADAQCNVGIYGACVSGEAQNPNNEPGYGDEVAPLAQNTGTDKNFGQEYRIPGERPSGSSTVGQSNVPHGNPDRP